MTEPLDPFESDLRTMLADRAGTVTADTQAGEAAVTARLVAGDTGLAEVVAVPSTRRGPLLLIGAAAVLLLVAVLAAVVMASDDDRVRTGPVATAPPSRPAVVELRPVLGTGRCAELGASAVPYYWGDQDCYVLGDALPANDLIESATVSASVSFNGEGVPIGCEPDCPATTTSTSEESYGVTLMLTEDGIRRYNELASSCYAAAATCPMGHLAIVVDDRVVSTASIVDPSVEVDAIEITGPFTEQEAEELAALLDPRGSGQPAATTTTTTDPVSGDDPTVGGEHDAAKDVAERVALTVFGEAYVTTEANDVGALTEVVMDGPGGQVVAEVAYDAELRRERLLRMRPADGPDQVGTMAADGSLTLVAPEAGSLSYAFLDGSLQPRDGATSQLAGGASLPVGPLEDDDLWMSVRLVTADGRVLRWLETT
jgi:hypothetical protein